jgi:hypothetical protein
MLNQPFYQLIEKGEHRRGVYSKEDYLYMVRLGWKPVSLVPAKVETALPDIPVFLKRKPGRQKRGSYST